VGQLGIALDPKMRSTEWRMLRRHLLAVQDGGVRNVDKIAKVGIRVQTGVAVFGRFADKPGEHLRIRRLFRVFDDF
jgi:hypothetical protein